MEGEGAWYKRQESCHKPLMGIKVDVHNWVFRKANLEVNLKNDSFEGGREKTTFFGFSSKYTRNCQLCKKSAKKQPWYYLLYTCLPPPSSPAETLISFRFSFAFFLQLQVIMPRKLLNQGDMAYSKFNSSISQLKKKKKILKTKQQLSRTNLLVLWTRKLLSP